MSRTEGPQRSPPRRAKGGTEREFVDARGSRGVNGVSWHVSGQIEAAGGAHGRRNPLATQAAALVSLSLKLGGTRTWAIWSPTSSRAVSSA